VVAIVLVKFGWQPSRLTPEDEYDVPRAERGVPEGWESFERELPSRCAESGAH